MQTALIKIVQFHLFFLYQKSSAGYFRPFLRSESGHGQKVDWFSRGRGLEIAISVKNS